METFRQDSSSVNHCECATRVTKALLKVVSRETHLSLALLFYPMIFMTTRSLVLACALWLVTGVCIGNTIHNVSPIGIGLIICDIVVAICCTKGMYDESRNKG